MELTKVILMIIALYKPSSEFNVDVKITDLLQRPLDLSQIENAELLVVELWGNGEIMYLLNLKKERGVFSPDFEVYTQDEAGDPVRVPDEKINKKCYFTGYVRGYAGSRVTMNFCHGITGLFDVAKLSYQVNKVDTDNFPSLTKARLSLLKNPNTSTCAHSGVGATPSPRNNGTRAKREALNVNGKRKIIELKMVVCRELFKMWKNESEVTKHIVNAVVQANWFFYKLSLALVASRIEIWSKGNKIEMGRFNNGPTVLNSFLKFRNDTENAKKLPYLSESYDAVVLNIPKSYIGSRGISFRKTMCIFPDNSAVVTHRNKKTEDMGALAGEIGHMLGFEYDYECRIDGFSLMNRYPLKLSYVDYVWPGIAYKMMADMYDSPVLFCLTHEKTTKTNVCGDGVKDDEEECDVGMSPDSRMYNSKCCNYKTCKLVEGAKCYEGKCCDLQNCKFIRAGVVCRRRTDYCDWIDTCSGTSSHCRNKYVKNGFDCPKEGFCFKGLCQSRARFCYDSYFVNGFYLFPTVNFKCYDDDHWNNTEKMNCGVDFNGPIKCAREDRECGTMICQTQFMKTNDKRYFRDPCGFYTVKLHPSHKNSVSHAQDGFPCGDGKFCIKHKCISVSKYVKKELEMYPDKEYSYEDYEIDLSLSELEKLKSGASRQRLLSLSCVLFPTSLLALFP